MPLSSRNTNSIAIRVIAIAVFYVAFGQKESARKVWAGGPTI